MAIFDLVLVKATDADREYRPEAFILSAQVPSDGNRREEIRALYKRVEFEWGSHDVTSHYQSRRHSYPSARHLASSALLHICKETVTEARRGQAFAHVRCGNPLGLLVW